VVFDGAVDMSATVVDQRYVEVAHVNDKGGAQVQGAVEDQVCGFGAVTLATKARGMPRAPRSAQRGPASGSGTTASGLSERNVSVSSRYRRTVDESCER
jgi:hypothetical protein